MKRPHLPFGTQLIHIVVLSLCWTAYGIGLFYVSVSPKHLYKGLMIALIVEVCFFLIVIVTWIRRHLFLHRTLQPRKGIPSIPWEYKKDLLNYKVTGIFKHLKTDNVIVIECNAKTMVKHYASSTKEGA